MKTLVACLALALVPACTEAKAPATVLRPLEERRAHAIIERVARDNGLTVKPGRSFDLAGGGKLKEDALLGDGPYGIAYLTDTDLKDAAGGIKPYDAGATALRLEQPADGAVDLILYEDAYRYDVENNGPTLVTAEATLERDVEDFIIHKVKAR